MNILITSAGRRTKLVEYFKNEFKDDGKVIVTDCDTLAPALYIADKYYIVPRIDDPEYLSTIKEICKNEEIDGILSLIDPELSLLSYHRDEFEEIGTKVIISDYDVVETCFDKMNMYKFLVNNGFKTAKTYDSLIAFKEDYNMDNIDLPVFVKPRKGSASLGINKIDDFEILVILKSKDNELLIQEFLDGKEYGIDVYVDIISKEIVSIFAKEKIKMRAGETDKAVSIIDEKLFNIIDEFVKKLGTIGPIDVDVFEVNGEYYISEVNPRFGGGYLLAYECGENFPQYIKNNLEGIANKRNIGNYRDGIYMLKHDTLIIK
ncbi:ATP-grasp domain-containing protein [Anaerosalibacter bizertensis]|uniref:ATP-grasp domain-containing protein n=1 Tax=Anaerosalibacter bizertensis TaxID=932217 RepID=A0A844FJP2_9FIRM|nr:ATP-grasp domain-containing protein [Anaerosalibacter bizertensis]MSS44353.1 ATP-grasp domain-containing protein [Anaerosalibacter bizertensis]